MFRHPDIVFILFFLTQISLIVLIDADLFLFLSVSLSEAKEQLAMTLLMLLVFDIKIIHVDEDPELLAGSDRKPEEMTYAALARQVKYKKNAGQIVRVEQVEMQHRLAYPFASVVVVLISAALAIQFGKFGVFVGFLLTMFISFIYWNIAIAIFEALGENGKLPPIVACWAANILFGAVGLFLIWKVRK